jgi:hypothetical protein
MANGKDHLNQRGRHFMVNSCGTKICIALFLAVLLMQTSPSFAAVLASSDGDYPGIRVEVTELKRGSGGTVTLKFAMINDSDKPFEFSSAFSQGFGDENYYSIAATYLLDPVKKKKHLVVRDADGKCVCSRDMPKIAPKSRANLWAKFPEPPADVQKITVVIPHFVPMDDVPISK